MFNEFDHNTIVTLTAALDHVCNTIPSEKDSNELRKRVADELVKCAREGKRNLLDFQNAGAKLVKESIKGNRSNWSRLFRWIRS